VIVALIVAMDETGGIGGGGSLPWHLNADMKQFRQRTQGHHLIVGRKTFLSIGRALPGRAMVVLSRSDIPPASDYQVAHSLSEALQLAAAAGEQEAMIGGGGEIFSQSLPFASRIYRTLVRTNAACDVFFPTLAETDWVEYDGVEIPQDDKNQYPFRLSRLERKTPPLSYE
jgi:dihydrofolate reductase